MVTLIEADRRSAVLTPSSIACLSRMPTVNLTSGCAHGCVYCYTRGYSTHPGEDKIVLYRNTLSKLKEELAHKRKRPQAVYFSPSSDLFQPVPEVLELGYHVLEFLLSRGIGIAFLSKGYIPKKIMSLLLKHADNVRAQVGIITLDENVQHMFEPNTADPDTRIAQIARLVSGGIATEARLYLATLNRLSGSEIPKRRAALLDNLLKTWDSEELTALLPDDNKQIDEKCNTLCERTYLWVLTEKMDGYSIGWEM